MTIDPNTDRAIGWTEDPLVKAQRMTQRMQTLTAELEQLAQARRLIVRELHSSGMSMRALGTELDMSAPAVHSIIHGGRRPVGAPLD